jgi:hypothetical protein
MARFDRGWVKFYRRAAESDLHQNVYLWGIWTTFLSWATRHEQKGIFNGKQRELPAGSVLFGVTELADEWGCSKNTISKWTRYLVSSGRIALETSTHGCIATICNWEQYQGGDEVERTERGQTACDARTPSEHGENYNGEYKNKRSNTRRSRADYEQAFEESYKTYPKQEGKSRGYKIWLKLTLEERSQLKTAIENYSRAKAGTEAKYLKLFSTFMGEWKDWLSPTTGSTPPKPPRKLKTADEINATAGGAHA